MKLQFKHQKFQADAAKAVVDVFEGQPPAAHSYNIDRGIPTAADGDVEGQIDQLEEVSFTGWRNAPVVQELRDDVILSRIQKIQRANLIEPSARLDGRYNLTIEMETGVGKTYTYIKTMYELNKHYGWSKFIVVVPSIAIREGVYKTFEITQEHFAEEYGKKIRFFIYNSKRLTEVDRFASDSSINAMIINAQAFNARGKDARRITMRLDEFRSRRPIDIIAKTNPILIIDEPQSVEGKQTKENLKQFHPMITLRYSATHRKDSIYNMVYRLDAMEAYNKRLVKKIAVKGITESGTSGTEGYVYLQSVNLSRADPTATIQFDCKGAKGLRKITRTVGIGYRLYENSNELPEYKDGFVVKSIDGRDDSVEFVNGIKIFAGDVIGKVSEEQLRCLQIRETILSHMERERELFRRGIKVLSLFFIDEVAHYKYYDETGQARNGLFADQFEEQYEDVVSHLQLGIGDEDYARYLDAIRAEDTHAGYFSIDKKGHIVNTVAGDDKKAKLSNDTGAYDLIMKNKELLLDRDPKRSPVRFVFSHSALREGWDNPNVFQICTLKQGGSEVRKRQEVGRGLRLCVNQDGVRQDAAVLGGDVHNVNVLTVIASESYDSFARALQSELAEAVASRPRAVTPELFAGRSLTGANGDTEIITADIAREIWLDLRTKDYIDRSGALTDQYYQDKASGSVQIAQEFADSSESILRILDSVYDENATKPEDARKNNVTLTFNEERFHREDFQALWTKINAKSVYTVSFDARDLIDKAADALDRKLRVSELSFLVEEGVMETIESKEALRSGEAFEKTSAWKPKEQVHTGTGLGVKYDLVGKLVEETQLTRKDIVSILKKIRPQVFNQFRRNPEDFLIKAAAIISDEKATAIIEHITYHVLDKRYEQDIFTEPTIRGKLGVNARKTARHIYDHVVCDSKNEMEFVEELETHSEVAVYVKLPHGFFIPTPVGKYNPDWAIAFYKGSVKHIYFVAETKGTNDTLKLNHISPVEQAKINCATEHFRTISGNDVVYKAIHTYQDMLDEVMK